MTYFSYDCISDLMYFTAKSYIVKLRAQLIDNLGYFELSYDIYSVKCFVHTSV